MEGKMRRAAVILCGCGSMDGSEVQESTMALLALCRAGYSVDVYAADSPQVTVFDHNSGTEQDQSVCGVRNQLSESARICRGGVRPLSQLDSAAYGCLVIPGGFGSARNLFRFAVEDFDFGLEADYQRVIESFHAAGKPIAAMCIAPLSLARAIAGVTITLGPQTEMTDRVATHFGCTVRPTTHGEAVTDPKNRVVTTGCYMFADATICQIEESATSMVTQLSTLL